MAGLTMQEILKAVFNGRLFNFTSDFLILALFLTEI
jgi:hypothetical protein